MHNAALRRVMPIFDWLPAYRREDLTGDVMAGLVVAIMLIPQGMAYALLAGLPPEVGLYASMAPLVLYALFGSSRALAVGPVALGSLMTASALGAVVQAGSEQYVAAAVVLALLSGAILLLMGVMRLGFLVNFLSHPVISGFTSAAALIIGFSQLKHLLGIDIPRSHLITDTLVDTWRHIADINATTAALSVAAILVLLLMEGPVRRLLAFWGVPEAAASPLARTGPLLAVALTTLAVAGLDLAQSASVRIVGEIPAGLPPVSAPVFDAALWRELLTPALLIAFVGFLESVSVAKALASKKRQKIDPDQELIALGAANLGAAFTGGYPVMGGFGRSVVNYSSGANTPLASIITAVLIAVSLVLFTPLMHDLPKAALAAVIVVAVAKLVDFRAFLTAWRYSKADGASQAATFLAVLGLGVELGIIAGAGLSIALYLWRTSRPHMAVVGRVGETEHFRNVDRHTVRTCPHVLAIRVDESLYFANTRYLEDSLLAAVADRPEIDHLVLICSAVNFIDASALETLETLIDEMRSAGVTVHLAEVKGPVTDRLKKTDFIDRLPPGKIFLSTHEAMIALDCV